MKTLLDRINSSKGDDIIKKYNIDGIDYKIKARDFKILLTSNYANSEVSVNVAKNVLCKLKMVGDNMVNINIAEDGKIECENCDGTGEHWCSDCECEHECGICDGTGYIDEEYSDPEVLVDETINLSQGELF